VSRSRHYYHVWVDGVWREAVREHVAALRAAEFEGDVVISLVGDAAKRRQAFELFDVVDSVNVVTWYEFDEGDEPLTLEVLRADLKTMYDDTPVLYAHTKGAAFPSPLNDAWRRSMTRYVVGEWRTCVRLLEDHDAVGTHWLTKEQFPGLIGIPFFGGNFWWARADYLRRLPPVPLNSRWDAEGWIGMEDPRVINLLPGWPSFDLFNLPVHLPADWGAWGFR